MKRIISIVASVMLCICIASCGRSEDSGKTSGSANNNSKVNSSNKEETFFGNEEDLELANENAKLVYDAVYNATNNLLETIGDPEEINEIIYQAEEFDEIEQLSDTNNSIGKAIYEVLKDQGGYFRFSMDSSYNLKFAQWSKEWTDEKDEIEGIVGQYPDPENDYTIGHVMGNRIISGLHDIEFGKNKEELRLANKNARLLKITINNQVADCYAFGNYTSEIKDSSNKKVVSVESLKDSSNEIDNAAYSALKGNDCAYGYIYFEIDTKDESLHSDNRVVFTQWSLTEEGIIGQYEFGELDSEVKHKIGEHFIAECPQPNQYGFRSKEEWDEYLRSIDYE